MYGTIRMHQERRYPGPAVGSDFANPDFAAACGRAAVTELKTDPKTITIRTRLSKVREAARRGANHA